VDAWLRRTSARRPVVPAGQPAEMRSAAPSHQPPPPSNPGRFSLAAKPLAPADGAEEEGVLEVDHLPDCFPAGLSDAVDDATHVVDLEGDVPEPRTVRGPGRVFGGG